MKNLLIISMFALQVTNISQAKTKIVYGEDNRIETYEASKKLQSLASSTAGMIDNNKLIKLKSGYMLPPETMNNSMGLCPEERFFNQPNALTCSGFLVGPNLMVTAGHCITSQERCDDVSFVFDFKVEESSKRTKIIVEEKKVYRCKKLISAKLEKNGDEARDFALFEVDRVVENKTPLKFRTKGKIKDKSQVFVIGHPSGLPQKIAGGANVFDNGFDTYFTTNLDTFGGNSGSAVFNLKTGVIEGILVRGSKDYYQDSVRGCVKVFEAPDDISGNSKLGESVSRITDIKVLKFYEQFMLYEKKKNFNILKSIAQEINHNSFLNSDFNTVAHEAVKVGDKDLIDLVISKGFDLNKTNKFGETPLHLAAFYNNKYAVKKLLEKNVNPRIKDKFGAFPSGRTNLFAFKLRKKLKNYENTMK